MGFNPDFRDLFSAFAGCGVRFLVVGAYAVTHYTTPRFTKDLDVWVDPTPANAERTWQALTAFGAPLSGVAPEDFSRPGMIFQIGVPVNRIDVLTSVEALEFEDCWKRRDAGRYADVAVQYLSRADLIRNKTAVGRPQDLLDVARLRRRAPSKGRRRS